MKDPRIPQPLSQEDEELIEEVCRDKRISLPPQAEPREVTAREHDVLTRALRRSTKVVQAEPRGELTDEAIDQIAKAQDDPDDGPWFTNQLTKLEWRAFARDIEKSVRAHPVQQAAGVPEGWKLVPLEATFDMRSAGVDAYNAHNAEMFLHVWRAMLAASPDGQGEG